MILFLFHLQRFADVFQKVCLALVIRLRDWELADVDAWLDDPHLVGQFVLFDEICEYFEDLVFNDFCSDEEALHVFESWEYPLPPEIRMWFYAERQCGTQDDHTVWNSQLKQSSFEYLPAQQNVLGKHFDRPIVKANLSQRWHVDLNVRLY
ncbi:MAG: hypothetical protein J0M18_15450, partial [Ignavibacteria bacterium]|nr:hypothetical protein [Ignavibacteria bacterium]